MALLSLDKSEVRGVSQNKHYHYFDYLSLQEVFALFKDFYSLFGKADFWGSFFIAEPLFQLQCVFLKNCKGLAKLNCIKKTGLHHLKI